MMLKALLVEQLEEDGTLRTFRMQASGRREIVVAFPHEFDEQSSGPFFFIEAHDQRRYDEQFAICRARHLGSLGFYVDANVCHFNIEWRGIPTVRNHLSYYTLTLPRFASVISLSVSDPHVHGHEYSRRVVRDDVKGRYTVYLKCTSSLGLFDFNISGEFVVDETLFFEKEYSDCFVGGSKSGVEQFSGLVSDDDNKMVLNFLGQESVIVGNVYSANASTVVAMGDNSQVKRNVIRHVGNKYEENVDLKQLSQDLAELRSYMRQEAKLPEHDISIAAIANAQIAAEDGSPARVFEWLHKAGKWALDVSIKVGSEILTRATENSLDMQK